MRHGRGYSRFEHDEPRDRARASTWFVPPSDPVRVARLRLDQPLRTARGALGDALRRVGARRLAQQRATARGHLVGRRERDADGAQPLQPGLPRPRRLPRVRPRAELVHGEPHRVPRPQRDARATRRRCAARASAATGRFHDNCGALHDARRARTRRDVEVVFLLGQTDTLEEARALVAAYRDAGRGRGGLERCATPGTDLLGTVAVDDARRGARRHGERPALYQALACRIWGRTATYQSSGAFGFRDQLQDVLALLARAARPRARRRSSRRRATSSPRATSCTGGSRISGRGVRTRFTDDRHWLPFVVAEYIEATGDLTVLDERRRSRGPPCCRRPEDLYLQPAIRREDAVSVYEHCIARAGDGRARRRARPAAHGRRRLERRHEPGRHRRARRERVDGVVPRLHARASRRCASCEATASAPTDYRAWADRLAAGRRGAGVGRLVVPPRVLRRRHAARHARRRRVPHRRDRAGMGGDLRRRATRRARARARAVEEKLVRWEDGLVKLLTPPFDHDAAGPRLHQGLRARAFARTAASTRTRRCGSCSPTRCSATATRRARCSTSSTRSATRSTARRSSATGSSRTWWPPTSTRSRRTSAAAAGPGTPARRRGSTASRCNSLLGLRIVAEDGRSPRRRPVHPEGLAGFAVEHRLGETLYRIRVENPRGVNRGVARVESTAQAA